MPELIYCAAGNRRFAEIATRQGYSYGAQLPNTIYMTPTFVDQDWRNPDRVAYMKTLAGHKPKLATVLDWEHEEQLPEVLSWAEQAAEYVTEAVIIIPKVVDGIKKLPATINGRPVRLGYSASSTFSSTPVSLGDFRGHSVHCLGGSVKTQMYVNRVVGSDSADGNYLLRAANERCSVYSPAVIDKHKGFPRLSVLCGQRPIDSPYIAFELSCIGAQMAWAGRSGVEIYEAQMAWLDNAGLSPERRQMRLF